MDWSDAVLLVRILLRDPGSWTYAAKSEWPWPASHEWQLIHNLRDNWLSAHVDQNKFKSYPSPWEEAERARKAISEADARERYERAQARIRAHFAASQKQHNN